MGRRASLWRALFVLVAAMLVPILPFAIIGELPGQRWLELSQSDGLRFGALGAGLLALDVLLPIPSSIVGAMLGGRLGFGAGFRSAGGNYDFNHNVSDTTLFNHNCIQSQDNN